VKVVINAALVEFCKRLKEKDLSVVREHLRRLEQPYSTLGDIKRLHGPGGVIRYRMHISKKFTVFFRIYEEEDCVRVDAIMTMEQAHKKYGKYLDSP
jgi:mRNA-degrading endonuclease RelE of RelBE toxin-antitoxin system